MKQAMKIGSMTVAGLILAGCATTFRSAKAKEAEGLQTKVASLESHVQELDQKVEELSQRRPSAEAPKSSARQVARAEARRASSSGKADTRPTALSTRQIQLALKSAGFYNGTVDGKFGAQTKEAVKEFQKARGLSPDGKIGPKTAAALALVTPAESNAPSEQKP